MNTYIIIYIGTVLLAMLLVPVVSRLAKRFRLVDTPGPRKVHQTPIPRIGGIAFIVSTLVFVLPVFFLNNEIGHSFRQSKTQLIVLLIAASFVFAVGLIDDLHPLRGYIKLLCLIVASLAICASSEVISSISIGQWFEFETGWMSWPLTVFWIVMITVSMNFIDGLDGLAAGIAAFVCGIIFLIAVWSSQLAMSVLMLALLGSVTGFLFFNFYPAKIFMGDSGSMFLGFMIGAGSIICQTKTSTLVGLAIPFLVMGLPILDMGFLIISRSIFERRSIFSSDRNHLHHRLMDIGLNHRTVVLVLYAVTAISTSFCVFILTSDGRWSAEFMIGGLILLFSFFACLHSGRYDKIILALRHNWMLARKIKKVVHDFEATQLRMSESKSFDTWWSTVCLMGEQMGFHSIGLWRHHEGNYECRFDWQASEEKTLSDKMLKFSLPLNGTSCWEIRVSICIDEDSSLELSGRKVMLLSRLMDNFHPPELDENKDVSDSTHTDDIKLSEAEDKTLQSAEEQTNGLVKDVPSQLNIMKIPVTPFESYNQVLKCVEERIESNQKSFCIAVNPLKIYHAWQQPELLKILQKADLCICDGIGVSIASKILHGISIKRCTGCDLFFQLLSLASHKGWSVYMLGASHESNSAACEKIKQMYPGLKIAGNQDGYFKDSSEVIEKINASKADLLFVAMGSPRQEQWIWEHWKSISVNFCMGVGGSFDIAAGNLKRAPKIFRVTGTEFLYRLLSEPRKRWKIQKPLFPFFMRVLGKKLVDIVLVSDDIRKPKEAVNIHGKEIKR